MGEKRAGGENGSLLCVGSEPSVRENLLWRKAQTIAA
jgi:hypothetical protein